MIVDIPGGSTVSDKERRFFWRDLDECFMYKFGNPTYHQSFEVVARKTFSLSTGEQIYDEIPSGTWMSGMQVSMHFVAVLLPIPHIPKSAL